MATIHTVRTDQEQEYINATLGEHISDIQSFQNLKDAAAIQAKRHCILRIMKEFDAFCEEAGATYFLMGDVLKGVVSYGDFAPGACSMDVGMMRKDYVKFWRAYESRADKKKGSPFAYWKVENYHDDGGRHVLRRTPRLIPRKAEPVTFQGDPVYDGNTLPMMVKPFISISIFDNTPDDFFTRKKFYRQMQRRNALYTKATQGREVFFDKPDPVLTPEEQAERVASMSSIRAFAYSLIPLRFVSWCVRTRARYYNKQQTECICSVQGSRSKTILRSDLGSCTRRPFGGLMLRCPDTPDTWATEPVMETTPELRRLQDNAKEIVSEIDRVCQVLGIEYFACGGTMLGYVRHGGFIPWDDDIDLGMFRADYERFKAEAGAVIDSERFFLQTRETDPNITYLFSKVRMNGTTYLTDYNIDRQFHKGICVDIFPFDYIPNGHGDQKSFKKKVLAASKAHNRIVNRQYSPAMTAPAPTAKRNLDFLIAQVNGKLLARRYWSKSLNDTQAAYDAAATTYDARGQEKGDLKYVASFVPGYTMAKVTDLKPFQRVDFEGIQINIPRNPQAFLRMQYGDYLVMPYPHQRAGHDLLLWSDEDGVGGGRLLASDTIQEAEAVAEAHLEDAPIQETQSETMAEIEGLNSQES